MPDYDENDLIVSLLDQIYTKDGKSVKIEIYRMPDTPWNVQIVDDFGNSTVWDDEFETDREALQFALSELARDGIDEFIGPPSGTNIH